MHTKAKISVCIYPGTFDPITNGHIDIIKRARYLFPKVRVLVARDANKNTLFSFTERVHIVKTVSSRMDGVECEGFDGLLIDYLKKNHINIVVRGLRAVSDFDYEFQLTLMNRKLYPSVEFVFVMPGEEYFFLSSSLIKEIASLGGDVGEFVPKIVEEEIKKKLQTHETRYKS
ncbi:pantetheine-phosphate adenylyltransferase [candidate division WOR-3 bacterium JGI_Cruoil_03_44_89]|uniref:Phosphopantetheine adenylyltransferase n=1 Tax=candidate division WOR-3 bacterium JGI_Cruoil_03_44_89 TaxID=1973748 RepID=A0A235BZI9_UNCW3|nr:MAG: pantetheine-phosphate adenylyltransferase [candidate division WOR-3 bacterium JGI_Cruoil_03_44_89]